MKDIPSASAGIRKKGIVMVEKLNRDLWEKPMEIREYTEYNEKEIVRLYIKVGWTAYTDNLFILP